MSPQDIAIISREVITLYGTCQPWIRAQSADTADAERLAKHFTGYPPSRVMAALRNHARANPRQAPKPNELLAILRSESAASAGGLRNPQECDHPEPFGFVEQEGTRLAFCRYCYTEFVRPANKILTTLEEGERRRTRRVT